MEVRQVAMVRLFGSLGPVDHQPKLLLLALWFLKSACKENLLPSYTGVLSCSRRGSNNASMPLPVEKPQSQEGCVRSGSSLGPRCGICL
jgi:hypothetical protein